MPGKSAWNSLRGSKPPRLLVSVRNVEEAAVAIRGGCDILDVKEPHRGSLGMAAPLVLQQIADLMRSQAPHILLSAALGEVHEYQSPRSLSELPTIFPDLDFVKLGCANLATTRSWQQALHETRAAISPRLNPGTEWVAVAYADWESAAAPSPDEVISEALGAGCRGVLIDTYAKSGRRLLDWIPTEELERYATRLHAENLFFALAGSLRRDDLPQLKAVSADIVAIRGAACMDGVRTDSIHETAIREFRSALHQP